jgi:hypothetical protein
LILRNNNAAVHKALSVKQLLPQKSITEMEHPPHFPYLAPNDFWLFPKINSVLKERKLQDIDTSKKCDDKLQAIPQQDFEKCFQKWQHRWTE